MPGTKISGGKRSANRARHALKMATTSLLHSDSALGTFYRRLCARMDKPRANTAIAHKLARMVYFMLTRGEDFVERAAALRRTAAAALCSRAQTSRRCSGFPTQPGGGGMKTAVVNSVS